MVRHEIRRFELVYPRESSTAFFCGAVALPARAVCLAVYRVLFQNLRKVNLTFGFAEF